MKILINASVSSLSHSKFDVGRSMFIFSVPSTPKILTHTGDTPTPVAFAQRLEDELHNHFGLVSFVTGR
jgi:hypothetical protein